MRQKKSVSVAVSSTGLEYTFVYIKRKRELRKLVQFFKIGETPIYSLGFGQLSLDGSVDDQRKADQNYRDQALTTVAALVYEFTARNPHRFVFFTGSDDVRRRLFCMLISAHFD